MSSHTSCSLTACCMIDMIGGLHTWQSKAPSLSPSLSPVAPTGKPTASPTAPSPDDFK